MSLPKNDSRMVAWTVYHQAMAKARQTLDKDTAEAYATYDRAHKEALNSLFPHDAFPHHYPLIY